MPIDPSVDPIFDQAAPQYNVDPDVLRAMHLAETGGTGRWDQTSKAGAQGGMQFLPETAAHYNIQDPTDAAQAIPGAAHYISDLLAKHEGNAGPGWPALQGALNDYSGGAPGYADKVLQYYNQLKAPQPQQQPAVDRGSANFAKQSGQLGDPTQPGWAEQNLVTVNGPNGVSFQVHKLAAPSFQGFVDDLARSGYPISSGGGYNFRNIRGGNELSEHAFGNAIDINPQNNPMGPNLQTDLPPNIGDLAAKWGLTWGGDWHSRKDPMHFEWTGVQRAQNGAKRGMDGLDALAAAGQQPPPPDASPLLQLAQANGPQAMPDISKLSDDDIATGLLNGSLPMPKGMMPAQATQSAAPSAAMPAPQQQPAPAMSPAVGAPTLHPNVQYADPTNAMYPPEVLRSMSAVPLYASTAEKLLELQGKGWQLNRDGSQSIIKGGPTDPMIQFQGNQAEAAGKGMLTQGPNGTFTNAPGVSGAAADKAAEVKGAELKAAAPYTPTEVKPGNRAITIQDLIDMRNGKVPAGLAPGDLPGVYNDPGIGEATKSNEALYKEYAGIVANNPIAEQNLRNAAEAFRYFQSGAGAELSAKAGAWMKASGIDPQKLNLNDPAKVEEAKKAATQAIFAQMAGLKNPALGEYGMLESASAQPTLQPEAAKMIMGNSLAKLAYQNDFFQHMANHRTEHGSMMGYDPSSFISGAAQLMPGYQDAAMKSLPTFKGEGAAPPPAQPGNAAAKPDAAAIEQEMRRRGLLK